MKKISIVFLQTVVVLVAIAAIAIMIRMPQTEGRAANLDLFHIYADPFILYGYASSIAFFIALYKTFRLLGYIGQNRVFTSISIKTLQSIRNCAMALCGLILMAGVYIRIFHHRDDDPAGFLALCMASALACVTVAITATLFENIFQKGMDITTENERLYALAGQ